MRCIAKPSGPGGVIVEAPSPLSPRGGTARPRPFGRRRQTRIQSPGQRSARTVARTGAFGWREQKAVRAAEDRAHAWRFDRARGRVRVVDSIVADYATSYCGRPVRRRDVAPQESAVLVAGVTWSVDGDVFVELILDERGPSRLLVYEVGLLRPIRKALRT